MQEQGGLLEQAPDDRPLEPIRGHRLQTSHLRFGAPPGRLRHAEVDHHRQDHAQAAGDVEHTPPADHIPQRERQDHAEQEAERGSQLQEAVDLPPHLRAEEVGDQAVDAGVARIVDAGGRPGDQERLVGRCNRVQPGSGAPDERRQREQLGPTVPVVEVAPQRVADRADDQCAGGHGPHLRHGDPKSRHDIRRQGTDQQTIGLMEKHEDEEDRNHEPTTSGPMPHCTLLP